MSFIKHYTTKRIPDLRPGDCFYWNSHVASMNIVRNLLIAIHRESDYVMYVEHLDFVNKYVIDKHTKDWKVYVVD